MLIRFDGKTVIVAGAARGIGQAIARAFADDGARVIACDRLVDADRGRGERIKAAAGRRHRCRRASTRSWRAAGGGRHAGLCRGRRARPDAQAAGSRSAGGFRRHRRRQPQGRFLFAKAVAPGMKTGGRRAHRHHLEPRRARHQPDRHPGLCLGQARPGRPGEAACPGARAVRHHREFGGARLHGDQPRLRAAVELLTATSSATTSSTASPCGAWASPRTSPTR